MSLCSPGYPRTHSNPPASVSQDLQAPVNATTSSLRLLLLFNHLSTVTSVNQTWSRSNIHILILWDKIKICICSKAWENSWEQFLKMKQEKSKYVTKMGKPPLQLSQVEALKNIFESIRKSVWNVCDSFLTITFLTGWTVTVTLLCGSFTCGRAEGNSCAHAHACSHSLPSDKRNKDAGEKSFQSPEKEACGLQPQKAHVKELGTQHNKTAWIACVGPWVSPHKDLMTPHMQLPKNPHRLCVCTPNFISLCISLEGGGNFEH